MTWFWIGIIVFVIGFVLRYVFKFKYYADYKSNANMPLKREDMSSKYRPLIFWGLAIEVLGCAIACISVFA